MLKRIYLGNSEQHILEELNTAKFYDFITDFVANNTLLAEIDRDWLKIAPFLLDYNDTVSPHQKDETSLKIKEYYMKGQPISRATTAPFIQVNIFSWLNNVQL